MKNGPHEHRHRLEQRLLVRGHATMRQGAVLAHLDRRERLPRWDIPLRVASLEGELRAGASGSPTTKNGQTSTFTISECQPMQAYGFRTKLPGSALIVQRSITREHNDGRHEFTHRVRFTGALAGIFAAVLGPGFMRQLPEVMHELQRLSEEHG